MAHLLGAIATLLVVFAFRCIYNLIRNFIRARSIKLPIVLVPVDQSQLLWLLLSPFNRHRLQRILPASIWRRVALTIFGWEFHEKTRPFDQFAPHHGSYLLVGLGKLELWTADPKATQDILLRVRDFEVPQALEYALGQYGPNVLTTNGDKWAKHRRIATSVIDERISKTVFNESVRQTHGLLDEVLSTHGNKSYSAETPLLFDMLKKITIHVLIGAGMGTQMPWRSDEDQRPEPGYKMTHVESLTTVVSNIVGVGILPTNLLTLWPAWLPGYRKMTTVGCAKVEVQKRSKSILDQERSRMATEESSTNNIMSKLLQASKDGSSPAQSLTEGEMISNLFIFTAAGFETTATTLAYAMVLLARYPEWQEWLLEQVDELVSADEPEAMEYTTIFPQATRIMAFMLETVRLYCPVPHVHRETTSPQTLETSAGTIRLPAETRVYINPVAIHLLPSWRDINRQSDPAFFKSDPTVSDEHAFRPSRWLNPPDSTHDLFHPRKGTFVPWAMGPRICPGQKMAQVEFTAVMLTLLKKHRIEAVPLKGERQKEIKERLDARLRDSQWVTVLQMNGVFDPKENEGLQMRILERR
ncbi:uncharacterized protein K452DRAFT_280347 [Aplosporella prunicola CBS 121167]|uniref:Cytochrome P450 n=1 Tax=Aplosporella prunicola CBS 121167 TaxID=1176127 RepID=A0A6A6AZ11_9PEZI|nr:uncharacterized protein K452DRAFT_280347 [Aplosporella prunicola CBS 121167]KAF2136195.1 hypothetical protein K452DRAFT_280347 [Aplosporella prunicola CBS 121167]